MRCHLITNRKKKCESSYLRRCFPLAMLQPLGLFPASASAPQSRGAHLGGGEEGEGRGAGVSGCSHLPLPRSPEGPTWRGRGGRGSRGVRVQRPPSPPQSTWGE